MLPGGSGVPSSSTMQWAAVSTQLGAISEPPQAATNGLPGSALVEICAIHGYSPGVATLPPTIACWIVCTSSRDCGSHPTLPSSSNDAEARTIFLDEVIVPSLVTPFAAPPAAYRRAHPRCGCACENVRHARAQVTARAVDNHTSALRFRSSARSA